MSSNTRLVKQSLIQLGLVSSILLLSLGTSNMLAADKVVKTTSGTVLELKQPLILVNSPAAEIKEPQQIKNSQNSAQANSGATGSDNNGSDNNNSVSSNSDQLSGLATDRRASYRDVSDPGQFISQESSNQKQASRTSVTSKQRLSSQAQKNSTVSNSSQDNSSQVKPAQANSGHIYFYSVGVELDYDADGDGYYSEFTVSFDVDTTSSYETVYASLYLSLNGGDWEHYFTTADFQINGTSSSDIYYVSTQLTNGFPPGSYDILIDLYDTYDGSLVASISGDDEFALAEYFLEDLSYENSAGSNSDFSIYSASIELIRDNDSDGYYQSFSLQFDADKLSGEAYVYAEIWVLDSSGTWEKDFTTEDFLLSGNSTLDTYTLETSWETGYNTGYYDFRVELYDAQSFYLLTTSEAFDFELGEVPLESADRDLQPVSGGNTGGGSNPSTGPSTSISHGSGGGGSFGFALLILALSLFSKREISKR